MKHLVMKDFYVNRKYILIAILYLGFALFVTDNLAPSLVFALAISYGIVTRSCFNDDKDRGNIFLRILPIRASTIVISKYVLGLIILLMNISIFLLLFLIKGYGLEIYYGSVSMVIFTLSLVYAIYLPVFFKYGYMKAKTFQTIFFIGIMLFSFGFKAFVNLLQSLNILGQGLWLKEALINFIEMFPKDSITLMLLSCFGALIMLTISIIVSLKFYNDSIV